MNAAFVAAYPGDLPSQTARTVDCADTPTAAPRMAVTVVRRHMSVTTDGVVTYCMRYAIAGVTEDTCQVTYGLLGGADARTRDHADRVRACYSAAVVGAPLPECWPR